MRIKQVTDVRVSDLTQIFQAFSHQPWSFLLDSAAPAHPDNNWDIAVTDPLVTLTTRNGNTEIHHRRTGRRESSSKDPFSLVQQQLEVHLPKVDMPGLPFTGGALGYYSYDLGRYVEKLPSLAEQDIQLPEMCVGIYDKAIILDRRSGDITLVAADDASLTDLHAQLTQPRSHPQPEPSEFKLTSDWASNITPGSYAERFTQIQDYLLSGDCYQINLAQRFSAQYQGEEWQAYLALRAANAAPFCAFLRLEQGCALSVSPERFVQVHGRQIETKPIKGTRPRFASQQQDQDSARALEASPKDRAENLMIVDLLRNDLGKVASPGSVRVPKLFNVESFPAVHHLVSTVTAELASDKCPMDLLRGAFPGGSITGAPKVRAMEIIEELEPHRRHLYCGAIGYLSSNGNMDTNIAIRTLVADQQRLHAWGGGGIVADSNCNDEFAETLAKLNRILPVLTSNV